MQMSKDDWVTATTCVGSALMLDPSVPIQNRQAALILPTLSQRLTDDQWNAAADMSEGMLRRTDATVESTT